MDNSDNLEYYKIYVDAVAVSGETNSWNFIADNGDILGLPEHDFWLPVMLSRSYDLYEYVEVFKDDKIEVINRQEINPYFIELSFFNNITKITVLKGIDLNSAMITYIKSKRSEVSLFTNQQVKDWFDQIGVHELPWNKGTVDEVTFDSIDNITVSSSHIISKANYFKIDINK